MSKCRYGMRNGLLKSSRNSKWTLHKCCHQNQNWLTDLKMNDPEEESMEVSGEETSPDVAKLLQATTLGSPESRHRSGLHNYSFNVSWTTWDKPPTPPRNHSRTVQLLSPARFTTSSPNTRAWKTLNLKQECENRPGPSTVKVSQPPFKRPLGDLTKLDSQFSPFKTTDSYEMNHNWIKPKHDLFASFKFDPDVHDIEGDSHKENPSLQMMTETIPVIGNGNNNFTNEEDISAEEIIETEYTNTRRRNGYVRKKRPVTKQAKISEKKSPRLVIWLFVFAGVVGLGAYIFMQINFCSEFNINVKDLNEQLYDNVFGQHIAVKSVMSSLENFVENIKDENSHKTLALSFHGWTGVGKNYISKFIAEAFHNSRIWWYLVPLHFINEDYRNQEATARQWILGNVTRCGINVFIIDEMDKASDELVKGVLDALETLKLMKSEHDNTEAHPISLFIFLSNSKASQINQYLISQLDLGRNRKSIEANEFQLLFSESEFEWYHEMYAKDLIDVYVPFMPLEEQHVRQCIIRDLTNKGVNPTEEVVDKVLDELSFLEMGKRVGRLSLTGCKRVQDKVDLHIED